MALSTSEPFKLEPVVEMGVRSPCNGICTLDNATFICKGCGRTDAEIFDWPLLSDSERQQIIDRLK